MVSPPRFAGFPRTRGPAKSYLHLFNPSIDSPRPFMRLPLCLLFLTLFRLSLPAQQCDGNLGENIFTEGDFGSGTANILTPDPKIAPGFIYQSGPPPSDGFYTITNSMAPWINRFPAWRPMGDNSTDPNGYMMVVNASYEPGLFYEQEVDELCENTLYQFTADIANVLYTGSNQLKPNVSFLIDGQEYFTSGDISEDERWRTYGFTFTTPPGQTTVTLALRNNAPGGFGNDLALDNISFRACGPEALILPLETANICEDGDPITLNATINGDQFPQPAVQWQRSTDGGTTWNDLPGETNRSYRHADLGSGRYTYRYLLANSPGNLANAKCRIVSNPKVVNVVPKNFTIVDTLCQGLTFTVGDAGYDRSGVYTDTLLSSLGCDSIVRLQLEVVPDPGLQGNFAVQDPTCSYLTDGRVTLDSVTAGTEPYAFTLSGSPAAVGAPIDSLVEGDYGYLITDRYGCREADTLRLRSPFPFSIDLGEDIQLTLGDSVTLPVLASRPTTSYTWTPPELVDCDSLCREVTVLPARPVTLALTAVSTDGCLASDSVRINVIADRLVYLPTAVSPNGDGTNDVFRVYGKSPNVRVVASLRIFDRWGGEVYAAGETALNDPAAGWDGRLNGTAVPAGTYVYVAEVLFLDGVVQQYVGSFLLLY